MKTCGPSLLTLGGGRMPVNVTVKLLNGTDLKREIKRNGEQWAKAMEYATKDMKRSAKTIVKNATTSVYNIKAGEVTPGSERAVGSCRLSGGMTDLQLEYRGRMLTPTHFGMTPRKSPYTATTTGRIFKKTTYSRKRTKTGRQKSYTVKATILRGRKVQIGHWRPPGSEGGKHSAESPGMLLPGTAPPVIRKGDGMEAIKVISMPQMAVSRRHIYKTIGELQAKQAEILERRLRSLGLH